MYRALKLGTGTILAQIISLVSIPIISRIYDPAEYGHLTLILSVTAILIPVATFRIETLIVVSDTDEEAAKLLLISAKLTLVVSTILFAVVFTKYFIFENLSFIQSLITSILFAMILLAQSISILMFQVSLRARRDGDIAISSLVQNLAISLAQIGSGFWNPSSTALITSYFSGRVIGIFPVWKGTKKILSNHSGDSRRTLEKYMTQLKASSPLVYASVIDSAILGLPIILISTQFGLQYSGYIGITQTILTVPITLVGGAFGSVILSELSSNIRDNQNSTHRNATIIRTFSRYLFYFSATFAIVTLLLGSTIFKLIFNDNWLEASRLVGYLAVPFGVTLLWQPLMSVYFASQQWNKYLKISISRLVLSTSSAALAIILEFDWIHVAFAFFIGNSIVQIYSIKDVFKVLRNPAKD
jgi:O-antigen/teichoic acid export membrane protein